MSVCFGFARGDILQFLILSVFREPGSKIMFLFLLFFFKSFSDTSFVPVFFANPPSVLFLYDKAGQVYEVRSFFIDS